LQFNQGDKMKKLILLSILLIFGCEEATEPQDCAGVAGGTAIIDSCTVCVSGTTNLTACTQDCAGNWGGDAVEDIEENCYNTVQINEQVWMKENLKVTHYQNGDEIPTALNKDDWVNLTSGAYAVYGDDYLNTEIIDMWGNLYNWYVVNDERGICPIGYHVPSKVEWSTLVTFLGGSSSAGGKMKKPSQNDWNYYSDEISEQATNESNFSATATGYRHYNNGYYQSLGGQAYFWTSTNENDNNAWRLNLSYNSSNATLETLNKRYGFSIRCLKD